MEHGFFYHKTHKTPNRGTTTYSSQDTETSLKRLKFKRNAGVQKKLKNTPAESS